MNDLNDLIETIDGFLSRSARATKKRIKSISSFKRLPVGTIICLDGQEAVIQRFYEPAGLVSVVKLDDKGTPEKTHSLHEYRYLDEWDVYVIGRMPEKDVPQKTKLGN